MAKDKCLIINDSSTAFKFSIFDYQSKKRIASGKCVGIGTYNCYIYLQKDNFEIKERVNLKYKEDMLYYLPTFLINQNVIKDTDEVTSIGYHFTEGSKEYYDSILVDDDNLRYFAINYYDKALPILVFQKCFTKAKTVISFDSTFYGKNSNINYHGLSYQYIEKRMKQLLQKEDINVIACHLGNTSSVCLINNKKKEAVKSDIVLSNFLFSRIDAKVGFMKTHEELDRYMAFIIKAITNYYLENSGNIDSIVFTGGIGKNSPLLRNEIISSLPEYINTKINEEKNTDIVSDNRITEGIISTDDSSIPVFVIPDGEDIIILDDIKELIEYNQKVKILTKKKHVL